MKVRESTMASGDLKKNGTGGSIKKEIRYSGHSCIDIGVSSRLRKIDSVKSTEICTYHEITFYPPNFSKFN